MRLCIIDLPGLSRDLLQHVPPSSSLGRWLANQSIRGLTPSPPAVTCSVQATLTTGTPPARHGIIANGLATYRSPEDAALVDSSNFAEFRTQVSFWEQSNQFVQAPRFWQDDAGNSRYKTAMLFFQNCMPGFSGAPRPAADIVLTPKPEHGPDGKITSLLWGNPKELVGQLFGQLGPFPLMNYWGPMAGIASSEWIAKAAAVVWTKHRPDLQLVYVPHLDYDLQRFGPDSPQAAKAVQDLAAALEPLIDAVLADNAAIMLLSEYAMETVDRAIAPNRALAEAGLLKTRQTADGVLVDYPASGAFALVDHQVAHVYTSGDDARRQAGEVLGKLGVDVLERQDFARLGLDHRRAGDLFIVAPSGAWLDYRWWSDPSQAPAFATTVDIHRKPGYDPLELFFDPAIKGTSQNASLLRGSHGRVTPGQAVLIGAPTTDEHPLPAEQVAGEALKILAK